MINGFPAFKWEKDNLWRVPQPLLVPPTLEAGNYLFMVGASEGIPVSLGEVEIAAPEHMYEAPASMEPAAVLFDGAAELAGYRFGETIMPGATLPVTLTWKTVGETRINYRTFVELVNEDDKLITASDMVPGDWERPATGWVGGEYIVEEHLLAIPPDLTPGEYRLKIGIYDADRMERIDTTAGENSWVVPRPFVVTAPQN